MKKSLRNLAYYLSLVRMTDKTYFIPLFLQTCALDPLAEEALFGRFREISDGRTALMISHRLSAALFCDRIVVLREGRIVEDGRHEELMTLENGIYRRMYETQAKYYRGGTGA